MTRPLLSVVVPYYGVEAYLRDCLESIRRSTLADLEVVLVDDGSPDASVEIAREYVDLDSRFRLVQQDNAGLGPARNTGTAHATGTYLTFVDSDDLVPRRAFEQLVESLEHSGSSFALGNAKRFSRTSGVRQSWTHQRPCARDARATHVLEKPVLVMDRMVWNKVYRRSFWDEFGYAFPAIKYEDYPVTMAAHLDALTVDVLRTPVYFWRERESGDSITQQVFRYDNLLDRVVSAERVLDLVDSRATPEVRRSTHAYLAGIDVVALAQAFAVVPPEDLDKTVALGERLMGRLQFDIGTRPRFDQLQMHALRDGDAELLVELARFRDEGGLVGGGRITRSRAAPWRFDIGFPGRGRSSAPRKAFTIPTTSLKLRSTVDHVGWDGPTVVVQGTAEITQAPVREDSVLRVNLVSGIERIALPVERLDTTDQFSGRSRVGFRTRVDVPRLAAEHDLVWPVRFELDLDNGGVHRVAQLQGMRPGSPTYPDGAWLSPTEWVQPGKGPAGAFCLHRSPAPVTVESATGGGDAIRLVVHSPYALNRADLEVRLPRGTLTFPAALSDDGRVAEVALPGAALATGDEPDDPFTLRATRAVRLETDLGSHQIVWPEHRRNAAVDADGRLIQLTRSPFGLVQLTHGPAFPAAVAARITPDRLVVEGRRWSSEPVQRITWRRFLPGTDDYVEIPCAVSDLGPESEVEGDGGTGASGWLAAIDPAELVPEHDAPSHPGAPAAYWTLFAELDQDGVETGVQVSCEPGLMAQLPAEVTTQGRHVTVTTAADSVHAQVR